MKKIIIIIICGLVTTMGYCQNILTLSDIHFDPYTQCSESVTNNCQLLSKLILNPINKWATSFKNTNINGVGYSTNNAFLTQALTKLAPIAKQQSVTSIFITGDLLSHNFAKTYNKYSPMKYHTKQYYSMFTFKTIAYVILQIHQNLPKAKIYFSLGNNDTDTLDYHLPSKQLLKNLASYLAQYMPDKGSIKTTFSYGGYYSSQINDKVKLISLNSNLLSKKGVNTTKARQQLVWLNKELQQAQKHHLRVIMLQHIPYGMDLFNTSTLGIPINLLNTDLQTSYLQLLASYAPIINNIYAGHLHSDYWSLIAKKIPLIGTVSISAIYYNDPGFKLIKLDGSGNLLSYKTYYIKFPTNKITWQILYEINLGSNNSLFKHLLSNFPANLKDKQAIDYRNNFNTGPKLDEFPIKSKSNWKYYYCGINHISESAYMACLNKSEKN